MNQENSIISMITKGYKFDEIVDKIASEYNAEKEQISADLTEYVISLYEAGLIFVK